MTITSKQLMFFNGHQTVKVLYGHQTVKVLYGHQTVMTDSMTFHNVCITVTSVSRRLRGVNMTVA